MKNIKKWFSRALREEQCGATSVEATLHFPMIFATILLLMYFLFFVLSYVAYGNAANSIAHQMNMRQTGFTAAVQQYYNGGAWRFPTIMSYGVQNNGQSASNVAGAALRQDQIVCNPNTTYLRAATYFALDVAGRNNTQDLIGDEFILPYCQVDRIEVTSSRPINYYQLTGTRSFSGTIIRVDVVYHMMNPFGTFNMLRGYGSGYAGNYNGAFSSIFNVRVRGYDVIA